jgi:lipoate-protein ligase A
MARDDALLDDAAAGSPSLRFYGWSEATVSVGYFQPAAVRRQPRLARLPWVRRPSGGQTLIHHHELTYALALPPGFVAGWMRRMHERVILPALNSLGLLGQIQVVGDETRGLDDTLCFERPTPGDLTCAGHKIVGSAQRKHRQALLQHGSILLAQSEHAPELPGIKELTGMALPIHVLQDALFVAMRRETGLEIVLGAWSAAEEHAILDKATSQYAAAAWNDKR